MVHSDRVPIHHGAIDVLDSSLSIFAREVADKTEATGRSFGGVKTHDEPLNVTSFGE